MSELTPNLELFKYDLSTDGKESFNITQSLNNNWDKLDSSYGNLNSSLSSKMDKVNSVGDSTTPIYVNNGRLTACSRSIPTNILSANILVAANGYCKFSNGFTIQWTHTELNAAGVSNYYVNFPMTYSTVFSIVSTREQLNAYSASSGYATSIGVHDAAACINRTGNYGFYFDRVATDAKYNYYSLSTGRV